jgi:glycosyltransferase involved in cell wall biosynthesis
MAVPSHSQALWPRVSVVIPTLNEARNLPYVMGELPSDVYEVIVVDGHSVDDTLAVARKLRPDARIVMQTRSGKGNALACGCAVATGDIIAMIDADGSTDAGEIPSFVSVLLDGADFAKGTRFARGGGSEDITRLRALGNRMLTGMVNLLYRTNYTDLCYGFNVFWQSHLSVLGFDTADTLSATGDECLWGDGFEIETLINIRVAAAGLAVAEVPSFEHSRIYGVSNLCAFSDGLRVFRTILYERFIVSRQGRLRFPGGRLSKRMSGTPAHRQVDVAGRSWTAASDSSARLNWDGPRSVARQSRLENPGAASAPEAPDRRVNKGKRPVAASFFRDS